MSASFQQKSIRFQLNATWRDATVEPHRFFADFLRDDLDLIGTRVSCGVQICGACTVLVHGKPVSCCTA